MCSVYTVQSIRRGHLLGNLNFYRPFGPMTIQAAEKNPLLAENDLLPAAVACRHLAFKRAGQWSYRNGQYAPWEVLYYLYTTSVSGL